MSKDRNEIFNDKISLIYEYNKKSPLFARAANTEIEKNNIDKAIEILNDGLKNYPKFAVAHFVLGKALTLKGDYNLALESIRTGSDLIKSESTYEYYVEEIENMKKQRTLFSTSRRDAFSIEEELRDEELFDERAEETKDFPEDDEIEKLAKEISTAKIPEAGGEIEPEDFDLSDFNEDGMIISETLAKIYSAQGEYKEAISVYDKLKTITPERANFYNEQIAELQKKLESEE